MEANECFIASVGKDWHKISNCNVHMAVKRRLQRTIIRGNEGDDLLDEGAESAEYTITGNMALTDYKEILAIFRGGQPWFHDPFEERQMKALFLSIDYDSATGSFEFILVEDAEQDEIKS
tara:strand:+ start:259 stop:618 length:360 start_codon:yes stop_codon:yes gene_type:complete